MTPSSQSLWDAHAEADPLWAVLSFPEKKGRRWQLAEFMKSGEREVALLFHQLAQLDQKIPAGRVLDFGCGVGRLTQAFGRRRDDVLGADISPAMIEIANRLNRHPERVRYISTPESGLDQIPDRGVALIYSNMVLQHVEPALAVKYLREFFRLLQPGGLLVFQLPSHRVSPAAAEIKPMPDGAYRASVEAARALPTTVSIASEIPVLLRVRNISGHRWSQPECGPMAVGNHWLDATGERMLLQDDARAPLLQVVEPGQEWPVLLSLRAPNQPGEYVAELDLVHEGVSWFEHKGSRTLRFALAVTGTTANQEAATSAVMQEYPVPDYSEEALPISRPADAPDPEPFAMHAVPHHEVVALIRAHGGTIVCLEEDRRAGPDWVSYRYFVKGTERR